MSQLPDVQAVLFDLDGTLLDRRRSFESFLRIQWERFSDVLEAVEREQYVKALIDRDRDGYSPRKELFAGMIGRFTFPSDVAEALLEDYRDRFPGACVLFPDAVATLSLLRASGLKLGLITNGSVRMQSRKLECLALSPMFDTILISDLEGISKPDRQIFLRASERLGVQPGHAVFVGDHPEVDVEGARAAGMLSVWRRDRCLSRVVEADAVIDELDDLLSLLGGKSQRVNVVEKVFAYITNRNRLLVFEHADFPEAGLQVPAGTILPEELPEIAVVREAREETGLDVFSQVVFLGISEFDARPFGKTEVHRRRFFHLPVQGTFPERWRHYERDASDGSGELIAFDFYWLPLSDVSARLIADHGSFALRFAEPLAADLITSNP